MYRWTQYLKIQLKRVGKALPGICLLTVALTVSLLFLLKAMFLIEESKGQKQVVQVGIVGDLSDTYLGIGINVIKNMEDIKSMANIESMTEEEAKEKFASGEISAYLLVPEGFVDSIMSGENKQLTYVTTKSAQGIGAILINELVDSISRMVTLTQNSIYAMQSYMLDYGKRDQLRDATLEMNVAYIEVVMNRMGVFELQELGVSNAISLTGHLFTGILLLLILLWGINSVSLMVREEHSLLRILHTKGLKAHKQVPAEVAAYALLQCVTLICVFMCIIMVKSRMGFYIREWDELNFSEQTVFILQLIPVVLLISTLQAFLYELVTNVVTGVLLQFIMAVSMAYTAGCIYPLSFFPEVLQIIGAYSPVGVALRYMQKGITLQNNFKEFIIILCYILLFVGLQIWRRNHRITKE